MTRDELLAIPDDRLRNAHVQAEFLVFMDFLNTPRHWWTGWGNIEIEGNTYQGLGSLIKMPNIPMSNAASAETVTFQIEGVTQEAVELVAEAESRVVGREVVVSMQFFDVSPNDGAVRPWSMIGTPMVQYTGTMDPPTITSEFTDGTFIGSINLPSYGIFSGRNAAANSRWTDPDQQRRFPGDLGCSRMPLYANGYEPIWVQDA